MSISKTSLFLVPVLALALITPADALNRRDLPFVQNLAQQLYWKGNHVYQHAYRQAHLFNPRERQMLHELFTFDQAAGRFSQTLHLWFSNQQMVAYEWNRMIDNAYRVNQAIYNSRPMYNIIAEWNECIRIQHQIRWYLQRNEVAPATETALQVPPEAKDIRSVTFERLHGE